MRASWSPEMSSIFFCIWLSCVFVFSIAASNRFISYSMCSCGISYTSGATMPLALTCTGPKATPGDTAVPWRVISLFDE